MTHHALIVDASGTQSLAPSSVAPGDTVSFKLAPGSGPAIVHFANWPFTDTRHEVTVTSTDETSPLTVSSQAQGGYPFTASPAPERAGQQPDGLRRPPITAPQTGELDVVPPVPPKR